MAKQIYNPALTKDQLAFVKDNRSLNAPYQEGAFIIEYQREGDIERVIIVEPSFQAAENRAKYSGFVEVGYSFEVKRIMANTGFLKLGLISVRDRLWDFLDDKREAVNMGANPAGYKEAGENLCRVQNILRERYNYPQY